MKKTALRTATAILDNNGSLKGKNLREAAQDLSEQVETTVQAPCPATELFPLLRRQHRHGQLVPERDAQGRVTAFRRPSLEELERKRNERRRQGSQVFARRRRLEHRRIARTHAGQPMLVGIEALRKELHGGVGLMA